MFNYAQYISSPCITVSMTVPMKLCGLNGTSCLALSVVCFVCPFARA